MKKYLIVAVSLLAVGCASRKEQARKAYVTNCVDTGMKMVPAAGARPIFQKYCECTADKILAQYSPEDLDRFAKTENSDIAAKIMPLIKDCMTTMQTEMQAYFQSNPGPNAPAAQ